MKSFPRIPSSSPIVATMTSQSTAQQPKVAMSLTCPKQSSTCPSMGHSRPWYLLNSPSDRVQAFHTLGARRDMPDLVSTRNLTVCPATHPGRYSPFPNDFVLYHVRLRPCIYCDGGSCPFPGLGCGGWAFPHVLSDRTSDTTCLLFFTRSIPVSQPTASTQQSQQPFPKFYTRAPHTSTGALP